MSGFAGNRVDHHIIAGADLFVMHFADGVEFSDTLMRFSECVESSVFAGRYFEPAEYHAWFDKTYGSTFGEDVAGINLTERNFTTFSSLFHDQTQKESDFLSWLDKVTTPGRKFYIIAVNGIDCVNDVIKHELSHALYDNDSDYRDVISDQWRALRGFRKRKIARSLIVMCDYGYRVIVDEFGAHAVFSGRSAVCLENQFPKISDYFNTHSDVQKILTHYAA